jgi:hypothetical protein
MAVNHYSADSAPRSRPSLHPRSPYSGNEIPVEIIGFPASIRELAASASPVYVLTDAIIYTGHSGCHRRLAEHATLPTSPVLTGTFSSKTSLD